MAFPAIGTGSWTLSAQNMSLRTYVPSFVTFIPAGGFIGTSVEFGDTTLHGSWEMSDDQTVGIYYRHGFGDSGGYHLAEVFISLTPVPGSYQGAWQGPLRVKAGSSSFNPPIDVTDTAWLAPVAFKPMP
jgi:hypothetical protein